MFEEKNDDFSIDKVVLFEQMMENDSYSFLDIEDFESIISYYLDVELNDKARKAVDVGLEQHPSNLSLSLLLSDMLSVKQQYSKAIDVLNKILPFYPFNNFLLIGLGKLYSMAERYDEANNLFSKALKYS